MNRPMVNYAENDNWISRTFKKAMKRPNLWWEPIVAEIAMLKAKEIFEVVLRPEG